MTRTRPSSIELFTGGGGLALGVHHAGFRHLLLVELDRRACETVRQNNARGVLRPAWPLEEVDIHDLDLRPWRGHVDLLAAGAPCQPFSLGGQHGGESDRRNLFPEAIRAVREVAPRAVLLENVKGLVRPSFFPYFEYVLWQLERPAIQARRGEAWRDHKARLAKARRRSTAGLTYVVRYAVLEAASYGVPQRRQRVAIVGIREDMDATWEPPPETNSSEALVYAKWVERSYWDELGVAEASVPESLGSTIKRLKDEGKPLAARWRTVRDALRGLPEPVDGEDHPTILNHRGIPGARRYKGHDGSPWDEPAKTLKAGVHGVPGGEATLLREDGSVRYFTVRESARLQTFPDDYFFFGARTEAMRQIGNAVPVVLAGVLARQVARLIGRGN